MVSMRNESGESCPRHDPPVLVLPDGLEVPRERGLDLVMSLGRMCPSTDLFQTAGPVISDDLIASSEAS
jgi:hypothetical protein